MPPMPKPANMRQRRNKTSTEAKLTGAAVVPAAMPKGSWHRSTVEWWKGVWSSPMVGEYTNTDRQELLKLLRLEEDFHRAETPRERLALLAEIRMQRQCFGLTAMDRRRLHWAIEAPKAQAPKAEADDAEKDPRDYWGKVH